MATQEEMFCDEFVLVDLRVFENCLKVVRGCDQVFNFAADMGGMGFIQSNHSVIFYNNTTISFNVTEACRQAEVHRLFYASSACIYPEFKQTDTQMKEGLRESDAWPAAVRFFPSFWPLFSESVAVLWLCFFFVFVFFFLSFFPESC